MLIKTFWKIIIKIIGLWLLFNSVSIILQFLSYFSLSRDPLSAEVYILYYLIVFSIICLIYLILIRILLFKTDWLIKKLKLENNFTEDRIDLNLKSTTIISISVIIIGGLIFVENLPKLCSRLYYFSTQNSDIEIIEKGFLIPDIINIIIGILLITKVKEITKYFEKNINGK